MNDNNLITSYKKLRKAIGILGMVLPFALLIGNYLINEADILNSSTFIIVDKECYSEYAALDSFKSSISHYYYSTVGELFTGILTVVAVFMFCYKGHPLRDTDRIRISDNFATNLAGFAAIGVAWFPCSADDCITDNVRTFLSSSTTAAIHYISAALFFGALAFMCIVNFRRTNTRGFAAASDSWIYLWCGIGIIFFMGCAFVFGNLIYDIWVSDWRLIWIFETLMLLLFGYSWLRKGVKA